MSSSKPPNYICPHCFRPCQKVGIGLKAVFDFNGNFLECWDCNLAGKLYNKNKGNMHFGFSGWQSFGFSGSVPKGGAVSIKCRIWWDMNTQAYVVSCPYNEKLLNGLKHVIPSSDREFDTTTKYWYVKEIYGLPIKSIAENVYGLGSVSFVSRTAAEQAQAAQNNNVPPPVISTALSQSERAMIQFLRLIPYEIARDMYRKAAHLLHPDKQGGDASKMSELNSNWSVIEREVYRK